MKCEHESARSWTHRQRQNGFVICPMLYAIAIGQIKKPNEASVCTYGDSSIMSKNRLNDCGFTEVICVSVTMLL